MGKLFYKPDDAWAADFMPFYKNGRFRLFYLHDWRNIEKNGEGTPWYQISTNDFIHFTEHGEMLPRGGKDEQDLYAFTGSVIEVQGLCHIFYTGHNPYLMEQGKPRQAIMHAVSHDLLKWEKIPEDTFYSRTDLYEPDDWRDPFVFWNEHAGQYWMLLAARLKTGPSRRRGCTALCVSQDLKHWEACEPFWAPHQYYTHECPDLFKIGDWWYLVYSTFTEKCVTHYRMSKNLAGPWMEPENDAFDGRAFYAAKTYSDGSKRYLFAWNPTRSGEADDGEWQWGGHLVVHEVFQNKDGTLAVKIPDTVDRAFIKTGYPCFTPGIGCWEIKKDSIKGIAPDSLACAVAGEMPACFRLTGTLTFKEYTRTCGLMLRASHDLENAYYIRLEPDRNRMILDAWPRKNEIPYVVESERPVKLCPGVPYNIKVLIEDSICEVYLNDQIAMSTRLYNLKEGQWGVFVTSGEVVFENASVALLRT